MTNVTVPEGLWEADSDGVLGTWFYNNGETVHAGRVIAEVLTEKITHEILSPADGALKILVPEEAPVSPGQIIAEIV